MAEQRKHKGNAAAEPSRKKAKTAIQREFADLVELTRKHKKYEAFFARDPAFVSTKEVEKSPKADYRPIVGIDCEMCLTRNIETREKNTKALVRVTLVDASNLNEPLLDLIVHQPEKGFEIINYKTAIHQIPEDHIDSSKISTKRARKEVLKFIGPDTIVIGHQVDGDLRTLGIHHDIVVDTAFLFSRCGVAEKHQTPALKDLTKQLLGVDLPDMHDSFSDAKMAILAAKYALTNPAGAVIFMSKKGEIVCDDESLLHPAKPANSDESLADKVRERAESRLRRLANGCQSVHFLVHRIPKGIFSYDIKRFISTQTNIVPTSVDKIEFKDRWGSCCAHFKSVEHGQLAFEHIVAEEKPDPLMRPTKVVSMTDSKEKKYKDIKICKVEA